MTTAEKIKIDKLWEFQLYEQGNFGDPKPVGEIVRDIDPHGYYGEDTVVLNREKRYAVKRREIVLDDQGYPTYGAWDWASEWKNVVFEKPLRSIRFRMPQWLIKLVRRR